MAFDQTTRNRLQRFVSDARSLLTEEFTRQLQNDYGLDPIAGDVTALENLAHLDDVRRETARILRVTLAHYQVSNPDAAVKDLLERIVREQAFDRDFLGRGGGEWAVGSGQWAAGREWAVDSGQWGSRKRVGSGQWAVGSQKRVGSGQWAVGSRKI